MIVQEKNQRDLEIVLVIKRIEKELEEKNPIFLFAFGEVKSFESTKTRNESNQSHDNPQNIMYTEKRSFPNISNRE